MTKKLLMWFVNNWQLPVGMFVFVYGWYMVPVSKLFALTSLGGALFAVMPVRRR